MKASDCSILLSFVPDYRDAISTPSSCLPDGNGGEQEAPVRRPHPPRVHQRGQGRLQPHRREQVGRRPTKILESNHTFRNPPCSDGSTPTCTDGSDPIVRNNICQREEKQCPQGQGKAVSSNPSSAYILASIEMCTGHCGALGCFWGWLLSSLPKWESRHLPFPHQKVC